MFMLRCTITSHASRYSKYRVLALLVASRRSPDSYLSNVKPLPSPVYWLKGSTVSLRPPVSRTIGQSARLESGRNEERVRACIDAVRQALIISDVCAEASLIRILIIPEGILVNSVAGSENHDLRISIHQLRNDRVDKIQALLVSQTGDQSDHELALILLKSQGFLHSQFILFLHLNDVGHIIGSCQQFVRGGIPHAIVDTVDDTVELAGVIAQMRIQILAVVRSLDLLRIGSADSGDHVGISQAALEHVGVLITLLERVLVEHIIRKS